MNGDSAHEVEIELVLDQSRSRYETPCGPWQRFYRMRKARHSRRGTGMCRQLEMSFNVLLRMWSRSLASRSLQLWHEDRSASRCAELWNRL